jgi:hypothetical protein
LRTRKVAVFVFELEEEREVFGREKIVRLKSDGMSRVERHRACGNIGPEESAVFGDLPLVVANDSKLRELAKVFLDWKNLSETPLYCESLAGVILVPAPVSLLP